MRTPPAPALFTLFDTHPDRVPTRRQFSARLLGLAGAAALTACGGGGDSGSAAATPLAPSTPAPAPAPAASEVIALLAGSGVEANQGAVDGLGAVARFRNASSIAFDAATSRLFVADSGNNVIRLVTLAGQASVFAGAVGQRGNADGAAAVARFKAPRGLSCDAAGNVFVAEPSQADNPFPFGSVRKITPAAVTSTRTTALSTDGRDLMYPTLTANFANGDTVVTDGVTVRNLAANTAGIGKLAGGGAAGSVDGAEATASFTDIRAMLVGADGNVYLLDRVGAGTATSYSLIRKISSGPTVTTLVGLRGSAAVFTPGTALQARLPFTASGLAQDANGNLITFGPVGAGRNGFISITLAGVASVAYTLTDSDVADKLLTTVVQMTSIGGRKLAATSGAQGTAVFTIALP